MKAPGNNHIRIYTESDFLIHGYPGSLEIWNAVKIKINTVIKSGLWLVTYYMSAKITIPEESSDDQFWFFTLNSLARQISNFSTISIITEKEPSGPMIGLTSSGPQKAIDLTNALIQAPS